MKKTKKGFTIIELLVVLAIIAVLSTLGLTFFSTAATKGRDSRREQDIKEIQNMLALYANNRGQYPVCNPEIVVNGTTDCLSVALIGEGSAVSTPKDPRYGVGTGGCGSADFFEYCYVSTNGQNYTLRYLLETDSIYGKSQGWNSPTP